MQEERQGDSDRTEKARELAASLLMTDSVQGVLALLEIRDHVVPHLFTSREELSGLTVDGHYAIAGVAERLLERWAQGNIAVMARGCDERHLIELAKKGSVDLSRIKVVGVACDIFEAKACHCVQPFPRQADVGNSIGRVDFMDHEKLNELVSMSITERRSFWTEIFSRCIKCYGCRNACPLCNCVDCRLEEERWVRVGEIPPEYPSFHLIRLFHLADKCVGCMACEKACPMGIPVGRLNLLVRQEMLDWYGYEAGREVEDVSPLLGGALIDVADKK